jgi:hypothetical protein
VLALFLTLLGLLPSGLSTAQEDRRQFRFHGYVQWIAGTKLMLLADNGAQIAIDLTEADQSSYQALAQGEGITVGGTVKPFETVDARMMPFLAFWIQRDRR